MFHWINLSWHSCSFETNFEWLNWFWQFLCEGLSFFNLKKFYYSYAWSCSLCEGRTSSFMGVISGKLWVFWLMISTGFSSLSVLLLFSLSIIFIFMQFLVLFHLTQIKFFLPTHLLMCLSVAGIYPSSFANACF